MILMGLLSGLLLSILPVGTITKCFMVATRSGETLNARKSQVRRVRPHWR